MEATYSSAYVFTVQGDYRDLFNKGRRVKINCDGSYKMGTVAGSTYPSSDTVVTLEDYSDALDDVAILYVAFALSKPGSFKSGFPDVPGSVPAVWKEGQTVVWMEDGIREVNRSASAASDGFVDRVYRTRGSLNSQSDVQSDDLLKHLEDRVRLNGGAVTIVDDKTVVKNASGGNAMPVRTVLTNNGSGDITLKEERGDGIISTPNQSMFKATNGSAVTIAANAVETPMTWDTEEYDKQSEFDLASEIFTAKVGGFFHTNVRVTLAAVANPLTMQLLLKKGSTIVARSEVLKDTTSGDLTAVINTDIELAASDTLSVHITQSYTSTLGTTADDAGNEFSVHKFA